MRIDKIKCLRICTFYIIIFINCCTSSSSGKLQIPLGDEVSGVTLSGPLEGKKMYLLKEDINLPYCWKDSVHWTGSELYYALSSTNFTKLFAGIANEPDPRCHLPSSQSDPYFDIYRAVIYFRAWHITHLSMNSDSVDAAMSLSGSTMVYTVFQDPPPWNLYFITETSYNTWSAPVAYQHNSSCIEDNAELYANGTRLIFESKRNDPDGTSCDTNDTRQLWYSEKDTSGNWSTPALINGAPNDGDKVSQPWVDEDNGYLYWTADSLCGCIRRVPFDGKTASGTAETVISPSILELLFDGDADGKIVFVGEYSHANGYAFQACGLASLDGDGTDTSLYHGIWSVTINLCVIPLE